MMNWLPAQRSQRFAGQLFRGHRLSAEGWVVIDGTNQ